MGAGGSPAERHPIAVNQLVFHREVQIRECPQESCDELLPGTDFAHGLGIARDVNDAIGLEGPVGSRNVAAIETLHPTPLVLQYRVNHMEVAPMSLGRAAGRGR